MDPKKLFVDERLTGYCSYCGGAAPNTRDHVPSRVLLDKPYPINLPVVSACKNCNEDFSEDEAYVACLIECAIYGTTNPDKVQREKISRILTEQPFLRARISKAKIEDNKGNINWQTEVNRIKKIILKLARGHLAYELSIYHFEEPDFFECIPFAVMSDEEILAFNSMPESQNEILPEMGSRAFLGVFDSMRKKILFDWRDWKIVQEERYRYRIDQDDGERVKFVLSEYLACTVIWD